MHPIDAALAEMRETRRPGLLIAVPDEQRFVLGELSDRLRELFVPGGPWGGRAVFACAGAPEVRKRFGHAPLLLALDPEGRPAGSREGAVDVLLQPAAFAEAVEELLPRRPGAAAAGRLPYGLEWAEDTHRNLFGTAYDPCPPCGMPRADTKGEELIRYLRLTE